MLKLGELIKQARLNKGLTQVELFHKLKSPLSPGYASKVEGKGVVPAPKVLEELCTALELDHNATIRIAIEDRVILFREDLKRRYKV